MGSVGPFLGRTMGVYVNGVLQAYTRSNTLSIQADEVDVTSKDSALWKDILMTVKSWSVSGDGLVALNSTANADALIDLLIAGTQVTLRFGNPKTGAYHGDEYWVGSAYVNSVEISAGNADPVTYSFSFTGDGALTSYSYT